MPPPVDVPFDRSVAGGKGRTIPYASQVRRVVPTVDTSSGDVFNINV